MSSFDKIKFAYMTKKMIIMTMTKAPTENKEVIIVLCDISLLALSSKVKSKVKEE